MKKIIIGLMTLTTVSAFAGVPSRLVCDSRGAFGLGRLTRVEFDKIDGVLFKMSVLGEVSCGQSPGCSKLDLLARKDVYLFESPSNKDLLVTPDSDISGDDISINFAREKCNIKSSILRLHGKLVDFSLD